MNRELIYNALFALSEGLTWGEGSSMAFRSRRVKLFSDIPEWPALCQAEHDETVVERTRMPSKVTLGAVWLIYHRAGQDTAAVPATESNAILDAIEQLFPGDEETGTQTLGGLVHKAVISGRILKEHGDLEGQALLIVPLKILVP